MPSEDTQFKPGNTASVGKGRPKIPDDIKEIRKAVYDEISKAVGALELPKEHGINELNKSEGSLIYTILARAVKNNDWKVISAYFERLLGRPKQEIDLKSENTNKDASLKDLPREKLERILAIIGEDDPK